MSMSFQRVGLGNQDQNYLLRYPTVLSCQPPYQLISSLQTASSSPIESERKKHAFLNLHAHLKPNNNPFLGDYLCSTPSLSLRRRASLTTRALLSSTKEAVLKDFQERRALKVLSDPLPIFCKVFVFLLCLVKVNFSTS